MKLVLGIMCALCLGLVGCSKGGKCEKVIDKGMDMAMEMAQAMGGAMGGDQGDEMKKKMEEAKAEMAAQKPEAIKKCEAALKENPELGKALDCVLEAKDMAAMMKCEGADKFGELMK